MKNLFSILRSWKWARVILVVSMAVIVIIVIKVDSMLGYVSDTFESIATMDKLFHCMMGVAMVIAISHLIFVPKGGLAREHLLFKRVGPIFSVPLTILTHGIFIYCGILIIYMFCYEDGTTRKYDRIDKTTITLVMLTLMTYAFYSIGLILGDIFNPKEEKMSTIVEENNSSDEETSEEENPNT